MKRTVVSFVTVVLLAFTLTSLNAQDCLLYFPDQVGAMREMKFFDKKNKMTSMARQEVVDRTVSSDDVSVRVRSTTYTADNDEMNSTELTLKCEDGLFKFDMQDFLDPKTMSGYEGMGLEMTGDNLLYPARMSVGDVLPSATYTMVVKNNGITLLTTTITISERVVEAKEDVTTEAGTFSCYKISYKSHSKVGIINAHSSSIEWTAPGVGVVKTESYDKKGKLTGYSELSGYRQ